jgi:PST family polysaccharide transporter
LGALNYALAWVGLFGSLAGLGLDSLVVRDLVRAPEEAGRTLGTAFGLKLVAGLCAAFLALLSARFVDSPPETWILILIIAPTPLFASVEVFILWFQAGSRLRLPSLGRLAGYAVSTCIRIGLVVIKAPLWAFALSALIESALSAAILAGVFVHRGACAYALQFVASRAKALLSESWPLFLSAITVVIYMRIDQILIPLLADEHQAGIYGAAVRVSELWYVVPTSIVAAAYPSVIATEKLGEVAFLRALHRLFRALTALGYLIGVVFSLGAPWIIKLLFGSKFTEAAPVLALHVWSGVFVALGTARSLWDTSRSATKLAFYSTAVGALINVVLNLALVPTMGALGSALATLIAYAYAAVGAYFVHPSGRPVAYAMGRSLLLI